MKVWPSQHHISAILVESMPPCLVSDVQHVIGLHWLRGMEWKWKLSPLIYMPLAQPVSGCSLVFLYLNIWAPTQQAHFLCTGSTQNLCPNPASQLTFGHGWGDFYHKQCWLDLPRMKGPCHLWGKSLRSRNGQTGNYIKPSKSLHKENSNNGLP